MYFQTWRLGNNSRKKLELKPLFSIQKISPNHSWIITRRKNSLTYFVMLWIIYCNGRRYDIEKNLSRPMEAEKKSICIFSKAILFSIIISDILFLTRIYSFNLTRIFFTPCLLYAYHSNACSHTALFSADSWWLESRCRKSRTRWRRRDLRLNNKGFRARHTDLRLNNK